MRDVALTSGAVTYWLEEEEEERRHDLWGDSAGRNDSLLITFSACFLDTLIIAL